MSRVQAIILAAALLQSGRSARVFRHKAVSQCGQRGAQSLSRDRNETSISIVNGQPAAECDWRWQVGIRSVDTGLPFCGGSLLAPDWVLTAAHCVEIPAFSVVAGAHNPSIGSANEQNRRAVQVIRHPRFAGDPLQWDFALVRLESPIDVGPCAGTVCLPDAGADIPSGTTCWISGWGTLGSDKLPAKVLQEATVDTISNADCVNKFAYTERDVGESALCAQGKREDGLIMDACQGDSGGPLVCEDAGVWTLYGVTSWGRGCADPEHPGIWARVHEALDWIHETMATPFDPLRCPDFARSPEPDENGDCSCPPFTFCTTNGQDRNCPTSMGIGGGWQGMYFEHTCEDCECTWSR